MSSIDLVRSQNLTLEQLKLLFVSRQRKVALNMLREGCSKDSLGI